MATTPRKRHQMSQREYRANINGINILFGAAIGFVLVGSETLDPLRFGFMLALVAGVVVSILYITASRHRLLYLVMSLVTSAILPTALGFTFGDPAMVPDKLQPTLIVWALMTAFIEFMPRAKASRDDDEAFDLHR